MERLVLRAGYAGRECGGEPDDPEIAVVDADTMPATCEVDAESKTASSPALPTAVTRLSICARTVTDLRRLTVVDFLLPTASSIDISVNSLPLWRGIPVFSPGEEEVWQHATELSSTLDETRRVWMTARFTVRVDAGAVLWAAVRSFDGHRVNSFGPLAGPAGPGVSPWYLGPGPDTEHGYVSRLDLYFDDAVRDLGQPAIRDLQPRSTLTTIPGIVREISPLPPVDERSINPIGFLRTPTKGTATLRWQPGALRIHSAAGATVAVLPPGGAVTEDDISALRPYRCLRIDAQAIDHAEHPAVARATATLACAGVPLLLEPALADRLRAFLGEAVTALILAATGDETADDLAREEYSIRLRRAALRTFGGGAVWSSLARARLLDVLEPSVSVLLPTRRPEMLPFALAGIAQQRHVDAEVIVGLHGTSADHPAVARALADHPGPVRTVEIPADRIFGEVFNAAARHASGSLLAVVDDDDWYGPDHLADLVLSRWYAGADLVGSGVEFAYLEASDLTVHLTHAPSEVPYAAAWPETLMGGSLLVSKGVLELIGGIRQVRRFVDRELHYALRAFGARMYRHHGLNRLLRRRADPSSHTWQVTDEFFLSLNPQVWQGRYFNGLMADAG